MTRTSCDLCGREIGTKKYTLPFYNEEIAFNKEGIPLIHFNIVADIKMDICTYCQGKIRKFLKRTNFKEDNE